MECMCLGVGGEPQETQFLNSHRMQHLKPGGGVLWPGKGDSLSGMKRVCILLLSFLPNEQFKFLLAIICLLNA